MITNLDAVTSLDKSIATQVKMGHRVIREA